MKKTTIIPLFIGYTVVCFIIPTEIYRLKLDIETIERFQIVSKVEKMLNCLAEAAVVFLQCAEREFPSCFQFINVITLHLWCACMQNNHTSTLNTKGRGQ